MWRALRWLLIAAAVDVSSLLILHVGVMPYRPPEQPTAIMQAAMRGDDNDLRRLISGGAVVNAHQGRTFRLGVCYVTACPDTSVPVGATPLMFAVDSRSPVAVRVLLEAGARIDATNEVGEDAVDRAIQQLGSTEGPGILSMLLQQGDTPLRKSAANAALMEAGRHGLVDVARSTLPRVDDDTAVELAMCTAAGAGHTDVLELLVKRLGRLPSRMVNCVATDSLTTLAYVLDHGIGANLRHDGGNTMLERLVLNMRGEFYATCDCRQLEPVHMVELLLQHGADPNSRGPSGTPTALELARQNNKVDLVELLSSGRVNLRIPEGAPLQCPAAASPCEPGK